jgi:uncharacterized protein
VTDWVEIAQLAVIMLAAGLIAGVTAGLLGVGGGIVVVPVLFQVLGFLDVAESAQMKIAVATSAATIIPTSISSLRAHARKDGVDSQFVWRWGFFSFVGSVCGVLIASAVQGPILTAIFASGALVIAAYMALVRQPPVLFAENGAIQRGAAALIGTISAMMGIGGGTFGVPFLRLSGLPMHRAVGTAAALGLFISIPAALGFVAVGWGRSDLPPMSLGYVSVIAFLALTPAMVLSAPLGARLAHYLSPQWLQIVFGVFLLATSVKMFLSLA